MPEPGDGALAVGTAHPAGLLLVRELLVALRDTRSQAEAVGTALELLCIRLSASAGLAWIRDPAGQWRLLRIAGDEAIARGELARQPEPPPRRDTTAGHLFADDAREAVWVSSQGRPVAVLRLLGPAEGSDLERAVVLDTVGEFVGELLERRAERERFDEAQRVAGIGSWEWRVAADELSLSGQMYRNLGTTPERFGHTLAGYLDRVHPEDRDAVAGTVQAALRGGGGWHAVHRVVADDGRVRHIETHAESALDEHGVGARLWGTGQDVSERRRLEQELARLAERDALTGLLNRVAFLERLRAAVEQDAGEPGGVVVVLVDLDDFSGLNRQVGWEHGDRVLVEAADRLRRSVPQASALARLTGDEFAALIESPHAPADLAGLGQRIAGCFESPETVGGASRSVTVRVGVAARQEGCASADELLQAAAIALEVAEERGSPRSQVFDPVRHGPPMQRLAIEADLRRAVLGAEIDVAYQPILELGTGQICGVEALARWHRPGHGTVSPAVFIPLAERAGLIRDLGAHVLERACRQLRAWTLRHPRAADWHVAVNLSAAQLDDPHLVDLVESVLRDSGLENHRLVLEVTETALSHDIPGALARLFELRRHGIRVAIDDFGTGYSSLARLRELPFDIVKIDRSFIQSIGSEVDQSPILQALFFMTQGLALEVVAEGVETATQLAALKAHQCGFVQGFLFSRPVAVEGIDSLLTGKPPWDVEQLDTEVPRAGSSPLQQLLNALVDPGRASVDNTVEEILEALAELTGLDSVYLTRIDLGEDVQEILAVANTGAIRVEAGRVVPWSQTVCRRALVDDHQVIIDVAAAYPDIEIVDTLGIRTYVGVEVRGAKGGLRGTLCGVSSTLTEIPPQVVEALGWAARLLADPVEQRAASPHRVVASGE